MRTRVATVLAVFALSLGVTLAARTADRQPPAADQSADPVAGNPKASVRIIIYQDLECPDCARWHGILYSQILPKYGSRVAFEFRDFPIQSHLWSYNAAVLARFFDTKGADIGLAWRDFCFTHQSDFNPGNVIDKAAAWYSSTVWAAKSPIPRAQFDAAMGRQDLFALVNADRDHGYRDKLQHTPTILYDGIEQTTPEQLEATLDAALRSSAH